MKGLSRNERALPASFKRLCRCLAQIGLALVLGVLPASPRKQRPVSHFYYVNDPSSLDSLQANTARISLVSPQWFSVGRTGQLESSLDATVVSLAKAHKLSLMPLLINQNFQPEVVHAVLSDERIQGALIAQLLRAAVKNRFYGIQLDFENIPPGDRDAYSRFARNLARALHQRRMKLSVAVPAPLKPKASPVGPSSASWSTNEHSLGFDYQELGKTADSITLMAYDEYSSPEDPGPIAGLPWVEACLRQTLDAVPAKKLLLGLPLYYRHWSAKSVSEGAYEEALKLANRWADKIEMNPDQKEQTFKFEEGGTLHVVWVHGAPSLQEGIDLVGKYRLAGFSAWRLGQEDPAAWNDVFPESPAKAR